MVMVEVVEVAAPVVEVVVAVVKKSLTLVLLVLVVVLLMVPAGLSGRTREARPPQASFHGR